VAKMGWEKLTTEELYLEQGLILVAL